MGRIDKCSETALQAAAEMLGTTKNQIIKAQLIRTVLDYKLRQQDRADSRKAERRKRAENKQLDGLRSKVQELTKQLGSVADSKDKEVSKITTKLQEVEAKLKEETLASAKCQQDLAKAEQAADNARAAVAKMEERLEVTNKVIEQLARSVCAEQRANCGSKLFQKWKSAAPELVDQVFKSMGLDLKKWQSWDSEYGDNSDLMLEAVLAPKKHEPEKLFLLRLKLAAMGRDYVDAINAVGDYLGLKITLDELKERTRPHITFMNLGTGWRIQKCIPEKHMPCLTEDALRIASQKMESNLSEKLEWLEVVEKLIQPDSGIGSLLLMELSATRRAAYKANER